MISFPPHYILASQSPQRRQALQAYGVDFEVIPADIDEKAITAPTFAERAQAIALAKAEKVYRLYPQAHVIAGDTYVTVGSTMLEKPASNAEAIQMLRLQSGQQVSVWTGYCYMAPGEDIITTGCDHTTAIFRDLSEAEIQHYVSTYPVTTWAGAFSVTQAAGALLFEKVEGSLSAFIYGLPMEKLIPFLKPSQLV